MQPLTLAELHSRGFIWADRHLSGQHDQKKHGHGGGASSSAGSWTKTEVERPQWDEDGYPAGTITVRTWKGPDGRISVYDPDVPDKNVEQIAARISVMQRDNPIFAGERAEVAIVTRTDATRMQPGSEQWGAWSRHGTNQMVIIGDNAVIDTPANKTHNAGSNLPWNEAVVTHEWGHLIDPRSDKQAKADDEKYHHTAPSDYGHKSEREAYAESFTDWYSTQGKTSYLVSRQYAEQYKWGPASYPRGSAFDQKYGGSP